MPFVGFVCGSGWAKCGLRARGPGRDQPDPSSSQEGAPKPGWQRLAQNWELRGRWEAELLQGPSGRRCREPGACASGVGKGVSYRPGRWRRISWPNCATGLEGGGCGGEMRTQGLETLGLRSYRLSNCADSRNPLLWPATGTPDPTQWEPDDLGSTPSPWN